MNHLWRKISPYFHILALVFTAGMAWAGVNSQAEKIGKLETTQSEQARLVTDLRISTARIEEGVKDIKEALHIKRRGKSDE